MNSLYKFASLAAAIFGEGICVRLIQGNLVEGGMPCSGICTALQSTNALRALSLALPWAGALYYLFLAGTIYGGLYLARAKMFRIGTWISGLGAIISVTLVAYTFFTFHGFCPWCTASAISALTACSGLLASAPPTGNERAYVGLTAAALALFLTILGVDRLNTAVLSDRVDIAALRSIPEHELFVPGRSFAVDAAESRAKRLILFASLGCGTCRRTIGMLRSSIASYQTCLRFVRTPDAYSAAAAELFLAARSPQERVTVLSDILEDDSRTIVPLLQIERQRGLLDRIGSAHSELMRDWEAGQMLAIKSYPLLVLDDQGARAIVSEGSLIQQSH